MKVCELIKKLDLGSDAVIGDINRLISGIASLSSGAENQLMFCKKDKRFELLKIKNCVVVVSKAIESLSLPKDNTYILVDNPRLWFIRCVQIFSASNEKRGIHPTALIGEGCEIKDEAHVGAYVHIGDNVKIGKGTKVHSGVHVYDKVTIGDHVVINSGCVIGADGFGYERNESKELEKFPHIGSVIIEDFVEIGANTCIDRGTLENTIVGEGTKIDNLVHIGHNAKIGKHCVVTAMCMIGRSVIGDYSWIGPCSCLRPGSDIGKNSFIGLGAVVTKNVPGNTVVAGVPARELAEFKKYLKFIKSNI